MQKTLFIVAAFISFAVFVWWTVFNPRELKRVVAGYRYKLKAYLRAKVGLRDVFQRIAVSVVSAVVVASTKAFRGADGTRSDEATVDGVQAWLATQFDVTLFWVVFFVVLFGTSLADVVVTLYQTRTGRRRKYYESTRFETISAVINRMNTHIRRGRVSKDTALRIIQDLLNAIVMYVREFYNHVGKDPTNVSASLLLCCDDYFVVVARDSHTELTRDTPKRVERDKSVCAQAAADKAVASVGMLRWDDRLRNDPEEKYNSICAIPLFRSDPGERVAYAVLSLDSAVPFYFQWLRKGSAEKALESELQPYIQLVTLAVERFAGADNDRAVRKLCGSNFGDGVEV